MKNLVIATKCHLIANEQLEHYKQAYHKVPHADSAYNQIVKASLLVSLNRAYIVWNTIKLNERKAA